MLNTASSERPRPVTAHVHFQGTNVTRRPALSHSLFPVAESGEGAQVGGLGEDNRVASCGTVVQWDRGRRPGVFPQKRNQVLGEKSVVGRRQTQVFALSPEAAAWLRGGACEVGVSEGLALKALTRRYDHCYF